MVSQQRTDWVLGEGPGTTQPFFVVINFIEGGLQKLLSAC